MDENKEVNSTDPKREKVRVIPLSAIDDAPDHPFGVRDDDEMAELVESISTFGVINPVIVRKGEGERYELISGHRRKFACAKLGIDTLPVIVRDLSREEAIIFMVDSNLQREHILPSERAKAYKMKMEAIKQQGRRTDLTSGPMVPKLSREQLGESNGECGRQISRYIRLNNLIPELLEDVDMGKIAFRPAVELSYLDVEEQKDLSYYIDEGEATPSLAQAIQMKKLSQAGVLTEERIEAILSEEKPNQKPIIKVPMERIQKYFSPDASVQEIEDMVQTIEDCGFWESIPLWAVTLIGSLLVWVLSFIMILTVYGRFFKLYMYVAIAPVPLSSFASEETSQVGKSFIKSFIAVCLEGAIIVLACIIYSKFATTMPSVNASASAISQVWSYIGEILFNMLVLVGTIKLSDQVVNKMMGV